MSPFSEPKPAGTPGSGEPAASPLAKTPGPAPGASKTHCPGCASTSLTHAGEDVTCPFCRWKGKATDLVDPPK